MNYINCTSLAEHVADKVATGVVDIKFYVRNAKSASVSMVCDEANRIFDAIASGAVSIDLTDDSHLMVKAG
jgi:hypothetical protein